MKIEVSEGEKKSDSQRRILLVPFFEQAPIKDIKVELGKALEEVGFTGRSNDIRIVSLPNIKENFCAVGLGKREKYSIETYRRALSSALREIERTGIQSVIASLPGVDGLDLEAFETAYIAETTLYKFSKYKSQNHDTPEIKEILISGKSDLNSALQKGQILGKSTNYARDFANMPPSEGTPSYFEKLARELKNVKISVIEKDKFKELGMGGLEGVSRAAKEPAKLVIMEYKNSSDKPFAIIGKGIIFDSGGISIKPSAGMQEMKFDKCGASAVLGVMKALSEMNAKVNVIGLAPLTENLPGGNAYKPGDILRHYNGKTSEVITTDAEGRLVMADALSYAVDKYSPKAILDISTLTGACVTALGNNIAGLMGNNGELISKMLDVSSKTWEKVWNLPIDDDFREQIKSTVADIKNTGGSQGGAETAGAFLENFIGTTPWLHLDIAGTAWTQEKTAKKEYVGKGATGFGVRLLTEFSIALFN
ncbi:MAG: leucyl aminopeptidase [Candidatus Thermoplasmatota archaeon]|nr:leucyl aminopeptidase [Candidatus Thermoplasmatota archaeon]